MASKNLTTQSINALKWNYVGRFVSLSMQFTIGIILARMLGPEPFGLIAIALFVQGLGNLFAEGGLGSALIQSQDISDHDIRSVYFTQILIGVFLSVTVCGLAPLIAAFFKQSNATPVIMTMALLFTIQAIGQTGNALIRRKMEFKKLQIISLASYSIGYIGLGLPLAYLDYGVWALVVAQLTQNSVNTIITYASVRHPVLPFVSPVTCRFLRFGAAITFNNITSWGIGCIDTVIIGRSFDAVMLGVYNRTFSLVNMPMYAITSSVQSVLFSAYARAQSNNKIIRRTFIASISVMALFFIPIFGAVATVPDLVISTFYGDKWQAAIPLMTPLCFAMAVHAMLAMAGPLLSAIGLPQVELKAQMLTLVISVPSLIIAAQYSLVAVAWTLLGAYILRLLLLVTATLRVIGAKTHRLLNVVLIPLVITALLTALCWLLRQVPSFQSYSEAMQLGSIILICAFTYLTLLLLFRRLILRGELKEFVRSLHNKLPRTLFKLTGLSA